MSSPAQHVLAEIDTQPDMWRQAVQVAADSAAVLPKPGERVAMIGCGTSWFVAQAYAVYREQSGQGETDAFAASEFPFGRHYDLIIALSRSGTTTEVLEVLSRLPEDQRTLAIIGDPDSPGATAADNAILLPFADEKSVVQTRFATTALAMLRAGLGEDLGPVIADCQTAVAAELPSFEGKEHFVYLGHGPTVGLAHEAALKLREAAIAYAESYPACDYRHGPIAVADDHSLVWIFGPVPKGLDDQIANTGATIEHSPELDPMADLVRAQRFAIVLALHRRYDPDSPRGLTRSIILED